MTYDFEDHRGGRRADRAERLRQAAEHRARHPRFGGFGPGFGPDGGPWARHGFAPGGPGFPGFDPHAARGPRRRSKGDVRIAIIAILHDPQTPSRNGYAIMKAIAEATEGGWAPSPGSVYPTLQQLVDEGLVTANGDGRSTEYSLTEEGRSFAAEHEEQLANWARGEAPSDATRALFESAGKLMAGLAQFRFSATDAQKAAATAKLDEVRKAIYLILAE